MPQGRGRLCPRAGARGLRVGVGNLVADKSTKAISGGAGRQYGNY